MAYFILYFPLVKEISNASHFPWTTVFQLVVQVKKLDATAKNGKLEANYVKAESFKMSLHFQFGLIAVTAGDVESQVLSKGLLLKKEFYWCVEVK